MTGSPHRPLDTAARLRRLLAVLTWLAQVGEASVEEAAERFDLTPEALVTELEMAACCGLPPYTPDQLMEIVVTDTTVSARLGTALTRPRRLGPREGFALAASARALLAVPGSDADGTLSGALAKLDRALGAGRITVELDVPDLLALVRDATAAGDRLSVRYYSASSDRVTEREITPRRVFASEGHWYVDADCELAGDRRRFRVDRIREARVVGPGRPPTGEGAGPHGDFEPFVPGPDARTVRISLDPSAARLVETVPLAGDPVEVDGRIELEVVVGGDAWLERLLLRLGTAARVVDPPGDASRGADAARRILARYRAGGHETA